MSFFVSQPRNREVQVGRQYDLYTQLARHCLMVNLQTIDNSQTDGKPKWDDTTRPAHPESKSARLFTLLLGKSYVNKSTEGRWSRQMIFVIQLTSPLRV